MLMLPQLLLRTCRQPTVQGQLRLTWLCQSRWPRTSFMLQGDCRAPLCTAPCSNIATLGTHPDDADDLVAGSTTSSHGSKGPQATVIGQLPQYCSGCGVKLQKDQPSAPGYYKIPKKLLQEVGPQIESGAVEEAGREMAEGREFDFEMEDTVDRQQLGATVAEEQAQDEPEILCTRCFSLVNYGKIKSPEAEGQLPSFDLAKKVGRKIALQRDRRAVVLCVVDVWDFDGSLPRLALKALLPPGSSDQLPPAEELGFKLMLAVNKFDVLPREATPARIERWARQRLKQAGLPRPERVFCVSATSGRGVADMVSTLRGDMGFRADLWVVGAQNSGKSSLINAMKRLGGTQRKRAPTVAPVPGTTLGLLRVAGIPLGAKHRVFDTPGVPHTHQLTSSLALDELCSVLPTRRLKARSYRVPPGTSMLLGGLARVDVVTSPGATLYLTAFVSDEVSLHVGKVESTDERVAKHVGGLLRPPFRRERYEELPRCEPRPVVVRGDSWSSHSVDVAIAGLGWVAVACKGEADLCVHVAPCVAVTTRDAIVPDLARDLQHLGFSSALPPRNAAARQQLKRAGEAGKVSEDEDNEEGGEAFGDMGEAEVAQKPSSRQTPWFLKGGIKHAAEEKEAKGQTWPQQTHGRGHGRGGGRQTGERGIGGKVGRGGAPRDRGAQRAEKWKRPPPLW